MLAGSCVLARSAGTTIGNLQKQDFQLTDRGKPQEIAQFALEGSAVPKAAQPANSKVLCAYSSWLALVTKLRLILERHSVIR